MKRISILFLLIIILLIGSVSIEAKTAKKKSGKRSSATVVGKFSDGSSDTFTMYSNGKIKSTNKCIYGSYEKNAGGSFYSVYLDTTGSDRCGDASWIYMIVGTNVYTMGGGTDGFGIEEFTYNASTRTVTIYNTSGLSDKEFMQENGLRSLTVPLSDFEKIGTVKWTK